MKWKISFTTKWELNTTASFAKRLLTSQIQVAGNTLPWGSDKYSSKRSNTHDSTLEAIQWDMIFFESLHVIQVCGGGVATLIAH